jgi:predicted flap endonuclease-1-like 5' DNA nuclease
MTKILEIEGIGASYETKLKAVGISSIEALLKTGSTPKGRKELEEKTGISHNLVLKWVNHADLFRVKGVGSEYSELLEAAGVDTVVELGKRKPENLVERMTAINTEKKLVRRLPTLKEVTSWVEQAKVLPRAVEY